jgi:hypothetical protein
MSSSAARSNWLLRTINLLHCQAEKMQLDHQFIAERQPTQAGARLHAPQLAWHLAGIWLGLRLLLSLWAALVSPLRPLTDREHAIALWPPSTAPLAWLERVLLAPWERWDAGAYLAIVTQGYRSDDGTAQFHPLLAWLATPLALLGISPLLALMIVGGAAGLGLFLAFERLALLDLPARDARMALLLLASAPPAFILFAPYTEALCLLWLVLCLLWARQAKWWLAGLAGALAVLTRQQGIFLVLPLAWELWEASDRDWRGAFASWRNWLVLGCLPAGLLFWLGYRAIALGDLKANLGDPQALIFSVLISPSSSKVVPIQAFLWPWQALGLALAVLVRTWDYSVIIDLALGAGFVLLLVLAWPRLRTSYRIYALTITLVSFAYYTGPIHPYMGLPRHLLLAFPVFIGIGPLFQRPWSRLAAIGCGILAALFLLLQYVISGWVP